VIFLHKSLRGRLVAKYAENYVQFLIIELIETGIKIGACYRPPRMENIETFEKLLEKVLKLHKNLILAGDMNLDLLQSDSSIVNNYDTTISSHFFKTLNKRKVSMGTRITSTSAKIIDHVLTDLKLELFNYCITNDCLFSDHRMIVINIAIDINGLSNESREFRAVNYTQLSLALSGIDNKDFESFHQQLISSIERHTYTKSIRSKNFLKKTWFDAELQAVAKLRDKFHKLKLKYSTHDLISNKFKFYLRSFRKLIKLKKK
jgi:hypothetical protein